MLMSDVAKIIGTRVDGSQHDCEIIEIPFFDQDHLIVRGFKRAIPSLANYDQTQEADPEYASKQSGG